MRSGPGDGLAGQGRVEMGERRSVSNGAVGMRDRRRHEAILATVLLLAAGLFGGLIAGAPNAAAGGPPDDPGSQGQDQGKSEEKRPDHAGEQGTGGEDGGTSKGPDDGESQEDGSSGNKGNGPPHDKGSGTSGDGDDDASGDEDAGSDDQAEEEQEPSADDETEPDRSEDRTREDDQEKDPLREHATTEDLEQVERLEGQAPVVTPTVDPAVPEVGQHVHLDAGAWDPDGEIVAIDWFLPDGSWSTGAQVSHVFELPGNHTFEVVATDDQGYTTTVTVDVQVLPATRPLQTPGALPASNDEADGIWQTGTDGDKPLRSSGVGSVGGGSGPLTDGPAPPQRSDTDRPLGSMAVIAAFLVAAAALVARVE